MVSISLLTSLKKRWKHFSNYGILINCLIGKTIKIPNFLFLVLSKGCLFHITKFKCFLTQFLSKDWNFKLVSENLVWLLLPAPGANFQQILQEASMRIRAKYDFYEMTLQVEEFHEDMEDCTQCQGPEQWRSDWKHTSKSELEYVLIVRGRREIL